MLLVSHSQCVHLLRSWFNTRCAVWTQTTHIIKAVSAWRAPESIWVWMVFRWHQRELRGFKNSCVAMVTLTARSPIDRMLSSSRPLYSLKGNVGWRRAGFMNISARVWVICVVFVLSYLPSAQPHLAGCQGWRYRTLSRLDWQLWRSMTRRCSDSSALSADCECLPQMKPRGKHRSGSHHCSSSMLLRRHQR